MTPNEKRACAYIKAAYNVRHVFVNPEGMEAGFYLETMPTNEKPYLRKVAKLVEPEYCVPFVVDVSGDDDRILRYLD